MNEPSGLEGWEERSQVIARIAAAGSRLTPSQLWRLAKVGLTGEPVVVPQASGSGKDAYYPPGTSERAIRALELAASERRLSQRAWLIWWLDGGEMSVGARRFLTLTAAGLDAGLAAIRRVVEKADAGDDTANAQLDEVYREAEQGRLSGPFAQARGRVGKRFASTLARVMLEISTGTFHGFVVDTISGTADEEGALFERALGLLRARTETLGNGEPWLQGNLQDDLLALSTTMQTLSFGEPAARDDRQLDEAREELRAFIEVFTVGADCVDRIFGRGAFGFRPLADALALDDYDWHVFVLLVWSELRADDARREQMHQWIGVASDVANLRRSLYVLDAIAEAIPAYRPFIQPDRIIEALLDPDAQQRFNEELEVVRAEHAEELNRVLTSLDPPAMAP